MEQVVERAVEKILPAVVEAPAVAGVAIEAVDLERMVVKRHSEVDCSELVVE